MDPHDDFDPWSRKCACGKAFYKPNSFSNHIRTCGSYKHRAGSTLDSAKAKYAKKKKSKKGKAAIESWYGELDRLDVLGQASVMVQEDDEIKPSPPIEAPEVETLGIIPVAPPSPPMGRGFRVRAPPQAYKDFLATSAIPFEIPMFGQAVDSPPDSPIAGPSNDPSSPLAEQRRGVLDISQWRSTRKNGFNLFKTYWTSEKRPHDPDLFLTRSDLGGEDEPEDAPEDAPDGTQRAPEQAEVRNPYHPFPNYSSFQLGEWFWSEGGGKSRQSFQQLVDIISGEDFVAADIRKANWKKIDSALAASEFDDDIPADDAQWTGAGMSWKTTTVSVEVPFNSASNKPGPKQYTLKNFRYRPLVSVIRAKLEDKLAGEHFHAVPSELWWDGPDGGERIRVHGDLYHSDAFLEAYREVQLLPPETAADYAPRYVVALMLASDETHLTSFGDAQIWPVYMHFSNESKNRRSKVSLKLFEEIAYFQKVRFSSCCNLPKAPKVLSHPPKLPDSFNDWYLQHSGKNTVPDEVVRHIRREVFQAQWGVLLDDEFIHAYQHGLLVDGADGVWRRFYPRILTYSADYPEKMRVVGVRAVGDFPCARCLVSAAEIQLLGLPSDRDVRTSQQRVDGDAKRKKVDEARKLIYGKKNYAVDADKVEDILKPTSLVPAKNSFSDKLNHLGLDVHAIPATDILHEVEIGVWKTLFAHLIRLLEAIPGTGQTEILNSRFRQVPTFGRDTIRRFRHNVSAMKQFGARDFEDLLQCSLPAFEGLFPGDHDGRIQDLLFTLAHWHSLAKLRMHTELSLEVLDRWTSTLGEDARAFVALTCSQFHTRELDSEYEARKRREARGSTKSKGTQTTKKKQSGGSRKDDAPSGQELNTGTAPAGPPAAPPSATLAPGVLATASAPPRDAPPPERISPGSRELGGVILSSGSTSAPPFLQLNAPLLAEPELTLPAPSQRQGAGKKIRKWSLSTPKFHSLGDVVRYIRRAGTTDSYSTQLSERYHRFPKSRYRRTNKKDVPLQLARIHTHQARIKRLRDQLYPSPDEAGTKSRISDQGYFIGKSQNQPVNLPHFLRLNARDPATEARPFLSEIIEGLTHDILANPECYPAACLPLLRASSLSAPTERDLEAIYFHSDSIYRHNILQVLYTTYDCLQETDTINPKTSRRDFMCLPARVEGGGETSPEPRSSESSDYVYGRILGIFHANIVYGGSGALDYRRRRFDFLWVRRYTASTPLSERRDSWTSKRLDRLALAPLSASGSWDFLDPADVLRGAHVIPRFSRGPLYGEGDRASRRFSKVAQDHLDWAEYYVNRFVDRDMTMRFHHGLAVGHLPCLGQEPALQRPADPGSPMQVDPSPSTTPFPELPSAAENFSDDEGSIASSTDESCDSSLYDTEPDSEAELDIYE